MQQIKAIFFKHKRLIQNKKKSTWCLWCAYALLILYLWTASSSCTYSGCAKSIYLFTFVVLYLLIIITTKSIVLDVVAEKELKIAETQKIMGLKRKNYIIGEFSFSFLKTLCIIGIPLIVLFLTGTYQLLVRDVGGILVFYFYINILLFISSMISFNLFLTTFFSKAKFASEIATLVNVCLALSYILILIYHE